MGFGKPKLCIKFEAARFSHCANVKGEPQILGSSPTQSHAHRFFGCDFMIGLGKLQLHAKFEVAIPSRCRNIIGERQSFGELP